jgi:uncharacterized membrane protein YcaP (DUF421 family)
MEQIFLNYHKITNMNGSGSFDWNRFLLGEESWNFLLEGTMRTLIMYVITVAALRIMGKRGVMQGVFEIVTIILLGSAGADAALYSHVGILPAMLVFIIVVLLYKLSSYISSFSQKVENFIEGKCVPIIRNGQFIINSFRRETFLKDELISDLRLGKVSQLGQVEYAYIEPSGKLSIFFFPEDKIRFGLPLHPHLLEKKMKKISRPGNYSCRLCGFTDKLKPADKHICPECQSDEWVYSRKDKTSPAKE